MEMSEIRTRFQPAIDEIVEHCSITEDFVDKEMFQVYIATVWGNAVLEPARFGIGEDELSLLHDFLNEHIEPIVGKGYGVRECYRFIVSQAGERCLARLEVGKRHREFLHYFARLILADELQG